METQEIKKQGRRRWLVAFAWLAVLVIVPLCFMLSDRFTLALKSLGVQLHPNLDDGKKLAEGMVIASPPVKEALYDRNNADLRNMRSFAVKEVVFRRFSGMGIADRLNLSFEFAGKLSDPHQSSQHFSNIVIHIFFGGGKTKKKPTTESPRIIPPVAFQEGSWQYQVIIDGFHDQPRIYDENGRLIALGLGLYLKQENWDGKGDGKIVSTRLTAALPRGLIRSLLKKPIRFYIIAGAPDLRSPCLLRLDESGRLADYATYKPDEKDAVAIDGAGRPILRPLILRPR
ncbi:MAG: hypothetical protein L6428_06430 [Candidatus Aminicenantes bacterium]|nr:hypothetical protein [Candidatus Aminicenantes bacterium]